MRKVISFIMVMMFSVSLIACGRSDQRNMAGESSQTADTASQSKETKSEGENKTLVAYFSWADNAVQDDIDAMTSPSVKKTGDVAGLASWVSEETGGDLFSIQVTEPYPADWDGCLERANQEKKDGTHPELKNTVENIEEYDTVYLGYPNWWYSCPMAVLSFLDKHDLSGKQVYLFCSHGTGGLAGSVEDISAAIPGVKISDHVFDVYEEDAASAKDEIVKWVKSISAH